MTIKLTVIHSLKVIDQTKYILVPFRHLTKDINLIADHMLTSLHQFLANHFDSVEFLGVHLKFTVTINELLTKMYVTHLHA